MTSEEVEALRARHRPAHVGVLFVGESAPASGDFVYSEAPNMLQRALRAAMTEIIGPEATFHAGFRARHVFVDDLVLVPVDKVSPAERRRLCEAGIPALAER